MSTIHACWAQNAHSIDETLNAMLDASSYWEPDKKTTWSSNKTIVGLAKAQLFNTQNSHDDGVFHDPENKLSITANARIDNREGLLSTLGFNPQDPRIKTDSQLILACYREWGSGCASYLRGDFVFVIWDEIKQKLFCARDHFGVKVLFYSQTDKGIMFSNEHNAFFTSGWCNPSDIQEEWLVRKLWGLGPQDFDSPNPQIQVLPPAHQFEIDAAGIKQSSYWRLEAKTDWQDLNDEALIVELKKRFKQAVVSRLDSVAPIGAELSEGLDSNGIVGFAARELKTKPVYTFSYQCEALIDANRHIWADTYTDIQAMLNMHPNLHAIWQNDEPQLVQNKIEFAQKQFYKYFGAVIPLQDHFLRSQLAQENNVKVLLSGWGGDHCVTSPGDEYAHELFIKGRLIKLYQLLYNKYSRGRGRHPLRSILTVGLKHISPRLNLFLKIRRHCLEKGLQEQGRSHFLIKEWRNRFQLDEQLKQFIRQYQCVTVHQHEKRELFSIGLTNRLIHSELVARQYRLEYRFPMLDVDLIEFAHSLPSRLKIHQGIERYPFRCILEGLTSSRIQWRRKADVDLPNINRIAEQAKSNAGLLATLAKNPLVLQYSSHAKLTRYIEANPRAQRSLKFIADFGDFSGSQFKKHN